MTVPLDATSATVSSRLEAHTRNCVLVLGMHRSGTSATARTLGLLGAALPKRIMGASVGNETGHWEPSALVAAHDRMLAEAGSRWDDWRKLDLGRINPTRQAEVRAELIALIEEEYGQAPLIVLKDPRICRFVPMYAELLASIATKPCCVMPLRNPLAVIESLKARNGMSGAFAGLLWLRHVLEAEASTRQWPRAVFSYEDLVRDWQPVIRKIGARLGFPWPAPLHEIESELSTFISATHQHHAASRHDLAARGDVADWIKVTYEALLCLERDPHDDGVLTRLDSVRSEFDQGCSVFGEVTFAELETRERLNEERIVSLKAANQQLERSEAETKDRLEQTERTITVLNTSIADRDQQIDRHLRRIEAIKSSVSWRIASPFRKLNRHICRADTSQLRLKMAAALRHPTSSRARKSYRARHRPSSPGLVDTQLASDILQQGYAAAVPFEFIKANYPPDGRVAAVIHMYYEDLAEEIRGHLANIPGSPDLFISTTDELKRQCICRCFTSWPGNVEIKLVQNRGRDIAPKLLAFRAIYDKYDYILHVHTKRSSHDAALAGWRQYLLKTLVGSPEIVSSIFHAFAHEPRLGMISPQHFAPLSGVIDWGKNFSTAAKLARKMQFSLNPDFTLDFPSGSMFWARSAALRPLLDLDLSLEEFDEEVGQLDATLAHAIERLFFFACEKSGFYWIKIAEQDSRDCLGSLISISQPTDLDQFLSRHKIKLLAEGVSEQPQPVPLQSRGMSAGKTAPMPEAVAGCDKNHTQPSCDRDIRPSEVKRVSYQSFPDQKGSSHSYAKLDAIRLPDLTGKAVLDIGCNEGFFCGEALRRGASRVVGIDSSESSIRKARARFPDVDFRCQTWDCLPNEEFDVIIMLSALHYEPRPRELMARIAQRLRPDGLFILETGVSMELAKLWFEVPRGVGPVLYPTSRLLMENVLADFSARQIGPSVDQAGDPLPRFVYHCRKLAPMFLIVSGPSGIGKSTFARHLGQLGADVLQADPVLVRARNFEIKSSDAEFNRYLETLDHRRIKTWIDEIRDPKLAAAVGRFLFQSAPKEKPITVAEGYAFEHPVIREAFLKCLVDAGYRYWIASSGNLSR